jgi:hypothetical protein
VVNDLIGQQPSPDSSLNNYVVLAPAFMFAARNNNITARFFACALRVLFAPCPASGADIIFPLLRERGPLNAPATSPNVIPQSNAIRPRTKRDTSLDNLSPDTTAVDARSC